MSRYCRHNPDEPIRHDWIQPLTGPVLNPLTNEHELNASEQHDTRGGRWWMQQGRRYSRDNMIEEIMRLFGNGSDQRAHLDSLSVEELVKMRDELVNTL